MEYSLRLLFLKLTPLVQSCQASWISPVASPDFWTRVDAPLSDLDFWGWSGDAMVLGKLPVPGRPTIWITIGQGPTAVAVGADGGCLDIFTLIYPFSPLSPSLWETVRYRLKYCLNGPLNPKQPTNQSTYLDFDGGVGESENVGPGTDVLACLTGDLTNRF